jgi:hypothetical protein
MIGPKCPECRSTNVSLLYMVWLNFTNGTAELDGEDSDASSRFPSPATTGSAALASTSFSIR